MLSQHITKLTKTRCFTYVKSIQNFNTGNKLMVRVPRDIKECDNSKPDHVPISSEDIEARANTDTSFSFGSHDAPPVKTLNLFDPKDWWDFVKKQTCENEQKCNQMDLQRLGNDLHAAYFIIKWRGQVKFQNSDWLPSEKDKPVRLPGSYAPGYCITAINASDTLVTYTGLENILNLTDLKWLSFKNCPYIDDWCVDRISGNAPALEYLDISGCKNVTERALESLYRLEHLNTLIITNHYKSAAFELTSMMLEDCMPNVKCQILNSRYSDENEKSPEKK